MGLSSGSNQSAFFTAALRLSRTNRLRCSAEVAKSVLDAAEEIVGGLAIDSLAVSLARVRQHDAEDMGSAALAVGCDDRGAGAEVDLGLVAGLTLEAPEGKLEHRLEAADEATDGVVAAPEAVFGREILVNALGAQTLIALGLDDVSPRLAVARATAGSAAAIAGRASGGTSAFGAVSRPSSRGAHWLVLALARGCRSRRAQWLVLAPPWPA